MQVIVRMPVTMAVVCTKGTVLQTRTPAEKQKDKTINYGETVGNMHFFYSAHILLFNMNVSGSKVPLIPFIFLWVLIEMTKHISHLMKHRAEIQVKPCIVSLRGFTQNILTGALALSWQ